MTTAIVALALALAAMAGGLVAGWISAVLAERSKGKLLAENATLAADLKTSAANVAAQTARADDEKRRADALDHLLASAAVDGPVDGAFDRLLQSWRAARSPAAPGPTPKPVPHAAGAGKPGPDDLLPPGA